MQSQGQFLLALPGHKFQLSPGELGVAAETPRCPGEQQHADSLPALSLLLLAELKGDGQAPWTFTITMLVSTAARLMEQRGECSAWIPAGGRGGASPLPSYLAGATCPRFWTKESPLSPHVVPGSLSTAQGRSWHDPGTAAR